MVYFGLFCLFYAQIMSVFTGVLGAVLSPRAAFWQMRLLGPLIGWVGHHVFDVDATLHEDSLSGDQTAMWVFMFIVLVIAVIATALWSVLDRRRGDYRQIHAWFVVFLRMCLGGQLLLYGAIKVIPVQMPAPPLTSLLQTYGQLSPNWVLWLQIGSSYPYEIALGAVELLAGILLFLPRTSTLGALLGLASMAQVFLSNMTFDVSAKIMSFQLLCLSAVLLAPHAVTLANVLIFARPSAPAAPPALFTSPRANKAATAAQVAMGTWILAGAVLLSSLDWFHEGGGRPKPELYGIWSVTAFSQDGTSLPPITTDHRRWQRLIVEDPDRLSYQQMNGQIVTRPAIIDARTITISNEPRTTTLTIDRSTPDELRLSGQLYGHLVTMTLRHLDIEQFPLRSNGFHWVQQYPDNPLEQ